MNRFPPALEKQHSLALAALGDGSPEASAIFVSSIALIAKGKDPESFRALASVCSALRLSGLWPQIEPVGIAAQSMARASFSPSSSEPPLSRFLSQAKIAKAIVQMSTPLGGGQPEASADAAAHPIAMLDQDVATCLACRWGRLPQPQAHAEIEMVKSGKIGSSNPLLSASAELFLLAQGLPRAPERTASQRL